MIDNFVECSHCSSNACYETDAENYISWQCMDCGFYTSTLMLKNSDVVKMVKDTSPSLINDLAFEDSDDRVWYPRVINVPKIGIIFPDGTDADHWCWSFARSVEIPEEQRMRYPVKDKPGEFQTHKIDYENKKSYRPIDYILALEESGLLKYFEN
jgi:hypothetical protein